MHSRLPLRSVHIGLLTSRSASARRIMVTRKRSYRTFTHREAVLRICCDQFDAATAEIVRQRRVLENYIDRHPAFRYSLEPVATRSDAPEIAQRMARAARLVGVGPMAAVAGAMAQFAAEAGLQAGASEAIVENGGDVYLQASEPVTIGIHAGAAEVADRIAFFLEPHDTPISICSSSGKMGHSMSLGECDLATVVAKDAALADAAATLAANLVRSVGEVNVALERIADIEGVEGVMIVEHGHFGLAGRLPKLIKAR